MAIDRQLRQEIVKTVQQCLEGANERYVTAKTLSQYVETLSVEWLKHNGACFDGLRTKVVWTDKDGVRHDGGSYLYPLHRILRMVQDGSIKELRVPAE